MTKARDLSKLLSTANGKIAGANLDVSFENISDTGTAGTKVASGTTGQRGSTAGQIRFNTTTGLAEYYTGSEFKIIDAPPSIISVSPLDVDSTEGGNITFTITGSNFGSGAVVKFIGNDATEITASTTTINSSSSISAIIARSSFVGAKEPYDVKVVNASGLSSVLDDQISVDTSPTWSTASGQIGGSIFEGASVNTSATATDADGDTVSYSVQSGTLPTGLSLNSSTGAITGTAGNVNADTTSSFTLRATANSKTADRAFNIIVKNEWKSAGDPFGDSSGVMLHRFEGNATDTLGNFNMTISGGNQSSAGKIGNAYHNGYTDYGYISNPNLTTFTTCMWINFNNLESNVQDFKGIWGNQSSGQLVVSSLNDTSPLRFAMQKNGFSSGEASNDKYHLGTNITVTNGTTYHLLVTATSTTFRAYVNGVFQRQLPTNQTMSLTDTLYLGTASTQLGNATYGTASWVDNLRIFNRVLSDAEVTALYNGENA
jgi:hypothetical protein